jgi:sugar lactone lactonase YvrE
MSPANGSLVRIPIRSNGAAGPIQTLWTSGPLDLPDGFAFGQSGRIYMALLGPVANKIVVLSPAGELLASYPSAGQGRSMPVPFDNPSSVVFNGTHLLVTNDGYFSGNRAHQVIFDIPTNDRGVTLLTPAVR